MTTTFLRRNNYLKIYNIYIIYKMTTTCENCKKTFSSIYYYKKHEARGTCMNFEDKKAKRVCKCGLTFKHASKFDEHNPTCVGRLQAYDNIYNKFFEKSEQNLLECMQKSYEENEVLLFVVERIISDDINRSFNWGYDIQPKSKAVVNENGMLKTRDVYKTDIQICYRKEIQETMDFINNVMKYHNISWFDNVYKSYNDVIDGLIQNTFKKKKKKKK
jgi:hypothetical protein